MVFLVQIRGKLSTVGEPGCRVKRMSNQMTPVRPVQLCLHACLVDEPESKVSPLQLSSATLQVLVTAADARRRLKIALGSLQGLAR